MSDFFQGLGALLGAIAFGWQIYNSFQQFLRIGLSVSQTAGFAIAHTSVENTGTTAKRIINALLLVGPETEDPRVTAKALLGTPIDSTNDLEQHLIGSPIKGQGGRSVTPVAFYYSENVNIADERLSYDVPIDLSGFPQGTPFAVRFFVFAQEHLHRSTEATFVVP